MSDAVAEYDSYEDIEEVTKLNDTDYKIHLYYYTSRNMYTLIGDGGTCDSEILEKAIPKADAEYQDGKTEEELDNIMQDLIVGHNFEYARKALLEWHEKHKG
jgi:hypothetical protein